ncbi:hypothetical protein [Methanosphaerula palustris]|nr:hypothetical protein [Methanosphaerula palustris]
MEKTDNHPAFRADAGLFQDLVSARFGDVTIPALPILNRTGRMS